MDRQNHSTPIESIMSTTMENLKDMIDVNVVVGDAVETGAGATIIPISRVSFGFVSGGAEYGAGSKPLRAPGTDALPFGGGAGAGVSVAPMGFLVLNADGVRMLPAFSPTPVDRLVDLAPQLARESRDYLEKKQNP